MLPSRVDPCRMTVPNSFECDAWRLEREAIDLAAVATGLLGPAAKRSGERLWWRCPFHADGQERTPSFYVKTKPGGRMGAASRAATMATRPRSL